MSRRRCSGKSASPPYIQKHCTTRKSSWGYSILAIDHQRLLVSPWSPSLSSALWRQYQHTLDSRVEAHSKNKTSKAWRGLLSLSLRFNGHFSRWTWVSRSRNISILDFIGAKGDGSGGNNWSYKTCKATVKSSPLTNQRQVFYRPDALPVAQPTVSKHWRESGEFWVPVRNELDSFHSCKQADETFMNIIPECHTKAQKYNLTVTSLSISCMIQA